MKKLTFAMLMALSTTAFAVGDVYEKGTTTPKTLTCTPPTTRAANEAGEELPITGTITSVITTKNVTTGITETSNADANCTTVYDIDSLSVGQYEVTAQAVEDNIFERASISSETLYFLVQPQTMPPNAPTGLQLQ